MCRAKKILFNVFLIQLPDSSTVPCPLGEAKASWSKVITWPPDFRILRRAPSVTLRAQICGQQTGHEDWWRDFQQYYHVVEDSSWSDGQDCLSERMRYLELGDILNPDIISDCSHNNSGSVLTTRHLHLTNLRREKQSHKFSFLFIINYRSYDQSIKDIPCNEDFWQICNKMRYNSVWTLYVYYNCPGRTRY